ncbi:hypothetical protein [uncultured Tateyamaria sp.]|uniref:hypothetical protein n=1 Tax=uncultured Tateyamaria sp. TaxID=455651 RepID=UPI00263536D7|nr:hypothetical protein [uncultured Tateyamaria sp.]
MQAIKFAAISLALIAAILLLYVVGMGGYILVLSAVSSHQAATANDAARLELYSDPGAVQLYVDNRQQCHGAEFEYYWICGLVIARPVTERYGKCSSPEHPIYSGTLGQDALGHRMDRDTFWHGLEAAGHQIMPGNVAWFDDELAGVEAPLPPVPVFETTQRQSQMVWARQGDVTALFIKGGRFSRVPERLFELETLDEMNASLPRVIFRHPVYPILVDTYASEPDGSDWPLIAASVSAELEASVRSFDPGAQCGAPPDNVQFRFRGTLPDEEIRIVRNWQNQRRVTPGN